ncbi:hypothetical protein HS125_13830 [bacterium]|nr:hypothetical protein [bacterium]
MIRHLLISCLAVFWLVADAAEPFSGVPPIPPAAHPETELSLRFYRSAMHQARYVRSLLSVWKEHPECLALAWNSNEHGIRPNTHTASGLAVLSRFGPFDPAIVGATRETVEREAIALLGRVTSTHLTGPYVCADGKRWGDQWQSAYWAGQAGWAAWLLWDRLPSDLQTAVGRMVEHEADRFLDQKPPAQVKDDTKAEENAWNAMCIALAAHMFPNHPRRAAWLRAAELYTLSSFLRAEDFAPGALSQYGELLTDLSGPNIHSDYTLENHARVHPDYMTTFSLLNNQMFYHHAAGRPLSPAVRHNQAGMVEVLKYLSLDCGGFYYANGQDWELHREPAWAGKWSTVALTFQDREAALMAERALEKTEKMQARSATGCAYLPGEWFFPSTQQSVLESQALAYLAQRWFGPVPQPVSAAEFDRRHNGLRLFEAGRFLCLRTDKMTASMSWGAQVMGLVALRGKDFLTSPDPAGLVGWVQEVGARRDRIELVSATVELSPVPCARLLLSRAGGKVRQQTATYLVEPDTLVFLSTLRATTDVTLESWSLGVVGIVNDPNHVYQPGHRLLEYSGGRLRVESAGEEEVMRPWPACGSTWIGACDWILPATGKPSSWIARAWNGGG